MPDKLREMQQLFLLEAAKYHVFPIDDRTAERFNPAIAGRPDLQAGRNSMRFVPGMTHLMENTVLNVKNRSHVITAEPVIPEGGQRCDRGGKAGGSPDGRST
jgi:arylsulfatase